VNDVIDAGKDRVDIAVPLKTSFPMLFMKSILDGSLNVTDVKLVQFLNVSLFRPYVLAGMSMLFRDVQFSNTCSPTKECEFVNVTLVNAVQLAN